MAKSEFQLEQEHFTHIEAVIQDNLDKLYQRRAELKEQVLSVRKDMWDEGRHLIRDFDDVIQLTSGDSEVNSAESRFEQNELEIRRQSKMKLSPYFGRLDYEEGGQSRTIYIGIYSLRREGSREMTVIDWRAPVSSMFYSFDVGPGWFDPPSGRRNVNITLKRQFKIENGQFLLMYDTDSSMYDEILGNVLSQNTSHRLKSIIGSIQKEQNAAIRSNIQRSCLIYGLAGSGKTSVGLHRLAYILYHRRDTVKSENILTISNSNIFSSYISTILPDLGEKAAENKVFHDLLSESIEQKFKTEDYYGQLKEIESRADTERIKLIMIKYSPEFLEYCVSRFADFPFRIPETHYKDALIISQKIFQKRWSKLRFSSFSSGFDTMRRLVREIIEEFFISNKERILLDIENSSEEYLSDKEVKTLYKRLMRQYITETLNEINRLNRLSSEMQTVDILRDYLNSIGESLTDSARLYQSLQRKKLLYEDALLYLFIRILMGEIPPDTKICHIVLDEAQDYNPLQLAILKQLYPKSSFTILADVYQTVNSVTTVRDYGLFDRIFGADLMKIQLKKCYRSSGEINALAFQLISHENPSIPREYSYFERSAKKPQLIVSADPLSQIKPLLEQLESYNSIGIITGDGDRAAAVMASLPDDEAQLILSPDDELNSGPVILPLSLAKGLEFDAVILVDLISSNKGSPDLRRKAYLGCTRALHELYLLESEGLPKELNDCLPYVEKEHKAL